MEEISILLYKNMKLVHGNPLHLDSLSLQTRTPLLVFGKCKTIKDLNYFLSMVKMYSSKSKINHHDILEGIDQHLAVPMSYFRF